MQILLFGERRFKDFTALPEHILINLLSDQLARLMARGVVEQVPPPDDSKLLALPPDCQGRGAATHLRDVA